MRLAYPCLCGDVPLCALRLKDRSLEGAWVPHARESCTRDTCLSNTCASGWLPFVNEVELFPQKLRRLRTEANLSPEQLAAQTVRDGKFAISAQRIRQQEASAGVVPDADKLEKLAAALDVKPEDFYEYPIAVARRAAASTPEAIRRREADALRKRGKRQGERPSSAPDTKQVPRRRRGQGP